MEEKAVADDLPYFPEKFQPFGAIVREDDGWHVPRQPGAPRPAARPREKADLQAEQPTARVFQRSAEERGGF